MIIPVCLNKRSPIDMLFIVFHQDFRFFPEGENPERVVKMVVEERFFKVVVGGFAALQGQGPESPPPQSPRPGRASRSPRGKGKPRPERRRWTCWTSRLVQTSWTRKRTSAAT